MSLRGVRGGNLQNARARGRRVKYMAEGGKVDFCSLKIPHLKGCEHYAEGGEIEQDPLPQPAHPSVALGHAAVNHGLLGLLKSAGHAKMADPEKHHKTLDKAKEHLSMNNVDKAVDTLHNHPLAGSVGRENLKQIVGRLAQPMLSQDSSPASLRSSIDYLHSAIKGHDSLDSHVGKLIGDDKMQLEPDEKSREMLKSQLEEFREDPSKMLEIGGTLGHYLPDHGAQLGATAAQANNYLEALRPKTTQRNSLDEPSPPDAGEVSKWNRHLDIAQNPLMVLKHAKEGTLLPRDITTLQTLYPTLHRSMVDKVGEALINAKTKKVEIPYRQKQGLSMLLGQPLDSTMTPGSMQAIIASAGPQQMDNQQQPQKKSQKVTGPQLKTIDKVDTMYETPLQQLQMDKKG